MRDIGPTFVLDEAGTLGGVDWVFNGWGGQGNWASWAKDAAVARNIAAFEDVEVHSSKLVNEGGGIHVNGGGTVLLTETVQLGKGRNPDRSGYSLKDLSMSISVGTRKMVNYACVG